MSGLMVGGNSILLLVVRLLAPVYTFQPLRRLFGVLLGVRLRSMVMPGWSVAGHLCRCRVLSRLQRAELWGAILALQASWPGHLGIDNLNVVRSIGRLLDHGGFSTRLPLVKDGDLIDIVQHMIRARGANTVQVTEVKGHATDADFDQGRVRGEDGLGNAEADTAAVFGRRHQPESVMDVGGGFCFRYRFMIAVSRVTVNHDGRGGTAPDPLVWDQGSWRKHRKVDIRVTIDLASLPGPLGFLHGPWAEVQWRLYHWCGCCGLALQRQPALQVCFLFGYSALAFWG